MVIPRHHIVMGINLLSPSIYSVPVIRAVYSCVIIASTRCSFLEMRHSVSISRSFDPRSEDRVVGLRLKFVRFKLERNIFQLIRATISDLILIRAHIFNNPRREITSKRNLKGKEG